MKDSRRFRRSFREGRGGRGGRSVDLGQKQSATFHFKKLSARLEIRTEKGVLCLLLWAFIASSFRRSGPFFAQAFLSLVDARSASKRLGSSPSPGAFARRGDGCL